MQSVLIKYELYFNFKHICDKVSLFVLMKFSNDGEAQLTEFVLRFEKRNATIIVLRQELDVLLQLRLSFRNESTEKHLTLFKLHYVFIYETIRRRIAIALMLCKVYVCQASCDKRVHNLMCLRTQTNLAVFFVVYKIDVKC